MVYEDRKPNPIEDLAKETLGTFFKPEDIKKNILQTFAYEYPERPISIEHRYAEFTSVCPYSGLPDFGVITIVYVPNKRCIELKSLKYYFCAFRQVKIFNEHVVNKILNDLTEAVKPKEMNITGEFTARGGITNRVTAKYP